MINNIHKYIKLVKQNSMFQECKIYWTNEYFYVKIFYMCEQIKMLNNFNYIKI